MTIISLYSRKTEPSDSPTSLLHTTTQRHYGKNTQVEGRTNTKSITDVAALSRGMKEKKALCLSGFIQFLTTKFNAMLINWFYLLLALIAGTLMPTQAAVNNKLATYVESPVLSAFISFVVGTVALLIYILAAGIPLNNMMAAKNAPWITWTGGLYGAFFVTAVVVLVPRLGVALTFSIIIAGQMLATLPIDHYGFLGTAVREISFTRILGVLFVIVGVVLIRKF